MTLLQQASPNGRDSSQISHDNRLVFPVAAAWLMLVATRQWGPLAPTLVAGVGALSGVVVALLRYRLSSPVRRRCWVWSAVFVAIHSAAALHQVSSAAPPWLAATAGVHHVQAHMTVEGEPRVTALRDTTGSPRRLAVKVTLHSIVVEEQTHRVDAPAVLMVGGTQQSVPWRSSVIAEGTVRRGTSSGSNELVVSVADDRRLTVTPAAGVWGLGDPVRRGVRDAANDLPTHARGLVPSMVTGDTSNVSPELMTAMREVGMSHITAVSGTNCSIIVVATLGLCALFGLPRRWRAVLCVAVIGGFLLVAHPTPSVVRASVMGTIAVLARFGSRPQAGLAVLAACVGACLVLWPELSSSWGFALSAVATAGMVLWAEPVAHFLQSRMRVPLWAGLALGVPVSATVACAPIIVVIQGSVSWVGILANVAAEPCIAPATLAGLVAGCLAPWWPGLAEVVMWLAAGPAEAIAALAFAAAAVPGGSLPWWGGEAGGWALGVLVAAVWLALKRAWPLRPVAALAVAGLLTAWMGGRTVPVWGFAADRWVFVACDVGQGDALLVRTGPHSAVMVDVGPAGQNPVRCLERFGVQRLDALILTHFHADHVGALRDVLATYTVPDLLVSPVRDPADQVAMVTAVGHRHGLQLRSVQAGESRTWGMSQWKFVGPTHLPSSGSLANNGSVVCVVRTSTTDLVLSGDVEVESSSRLSEHLSLTLPGWRPHVLKVPHHGSRTIDPRFLTEPAAELAVISVGRNNRYGHPHPWVLNTLNRTSLSVARTDTDGDVAVAESEEGLVWVKGGSG